MKKADIIKKSEAFFRNRYKGKYTEQEIKAYIKTISEKLDISLKSAYEFEQSFLSKLDSQPKGKSPIMRKYRFVAPYDSKGKARIQSIKKRSGIYIIKENNKIVYVGMSGYNLYKTMYRHFQSWEDTQYRVTYQDQIDTNKYTVRVVLCSPAKAEKLEKGLILKYQPRDNAHKYEQLTKDAKTDLYVANYQEIPVVKTDEPF